MTETDGAEGSMASAATVWTPSSLTKRSPVSAAEMTETSSCLNREMMAAASADLPLDALIDEMMIDGIYGTYGTQARLYEPRIVRLVCDMDYTSGLKIK